MNSWSPCPGSIIHDMLLLHIMSFAFNIIRHSFDELYISNKKNWFKISYIYVVVIVPFYTCQVVPSYIISNYSFYTISNCPIIHNVHLSLFFFPLFFRQKTNTANAKWIEQEKRKHETPSRKRKQDWPKLPTGQDSPSKHHPHPAGHGQPPSSHYPSTSGG